MKYCILVIYCLLFCVAATAQRCDSLDVLSPATRTAFLKSVTKKYTALHQQLLHNDRKTLAALKHREKKIYKDLHKKDTVAAQRLQAASTTYYEQQAQQTEAVDTSLRLKEYIPQLDSVHTTLNFLQQCASGKDDADLLAARQAVQKLEARMQYSNQLKKQLKSRRDALRKELDQYGLDKQVQGLEKTMYYYQEQLRQYKALVSDRKKLEKKAMAALRNSTVFKDFMKKNSMLARLFRLPDNYGTPEHMATLQTRAGVEALLSQRLAGSGVNPTEHMRQQMGAAQAELSQLRNKVKRIGGSSSSDIDMPAGFKPNSQKTKSFLQRLELGANIQTQRMNSYFPVTSDLALTVGYKLNDKSVVGIGVAYKMGWGQGIEQIRLTHEGAGLRSFVDWKLKGQLWITGGYEQNYLQRFADFRQISDISLWRQSGLLGLTKKMNVGKKETKLQLLFDFLHTNNNVRTQPLIFRVGYGF